MRAPASELGELPRYRRSCHGPVTEVLAVLVTTQVTLMVWPTCALAGAESAPSTRSPLVIWLLCEATAVLLFSLSSATSLLPSARTIK